MPRLTRRDPTYRLHKASGHAIVTIDGKDRYLGPHGTAASRAEYRRVIDEWRTAREADRLAAPAPRATSPLTVDEMILRYWEFARDFYREDGRPTRELDNIKDAVRPLRRLYGPTLAAAFDVPQYKAVRKSMIDAGLGRKTINFRLGKVRRMLRWAAEEKLIPGSVPAAIAPVQPLQKGRQGVRETEPVRPVPLAVVEATLPHLPAPVAAMVRVQLLCGCRPGEVAGMRGREIDMTKAVWAYRPARHKTSRYDKDRLILLGPKAQEVLRPWLKEDPETYLFSPAESARLHNAGRRARRKTPMTPSESRRSPKASRKRAPRDRYEKNAYGQAIDRACDRAFPHPILSKLRRKDLTDEQKVELTGWRKRHRWHPNRLRHTAATEIRSLYGVEAAQVILGHSGLATTLIYAESDEEKAREIMRQVG